MGGSLTIVGSDPDFTKYDQTLARNFAPGFLETSPDLFALDLRQVLTASSHPFGLKRRFTYKGLSPYKFMPMLGVQNAIKLAGLAASSLSRCSVKKLYKPLQRYLLISY
jgi:hypothetical protein